MSDSHQESDRTRTLRMVILAILGLVVVNVGGALIFDRDTGFGADDGLYILGGLALAAAVEFGYFRRR